MEQTEKVPRLPSREDDFVSTAPGTPAGSYLRTFWNPIYHAIDLKPGRPVPLRIMSESFTLYRGDGGEAHLVEARCPHRGMQLSAGRVEGDTLEIRARRALLRAAGRRVAVLRPGVDQDLAGAGASWIDLRLSR
jgi:phenylpropionate dioxygenase-like ring-hydroxylating dioxygenase large terminal subunit